MSKEAIAKAPSGRVRRTPVGVRNVLTVSGKDPNYVYRIVNDIGDRVEQFKEAGYETVPAKEVRIGDRRINGTSPEGSLAQTSVGGGMKGIVMRIRKDWYEEDQRSKQTQVDQTEAATRKEALNGTYGKIETSTSLDKE